METLYSLLKSGEETLKAAGVREYKLDAWYLLSYVTGVDRTKYLCDKFKSVPEKQACRYRELAGRRAERIPLQQITGRQEFMGLSFVVNSNVLIPRQDTEILVEEAGKLLLDKRGVRVLDLCTGSGCILISLEYYYGKRGNGAVSYAVGSDISPEALAVAEQNARMNGSDISLVKGDLFENIEGKYDLIVSNPPYIRTDVIASLEPEVREHEPALALDGQADGLYFYRKIIAEAKQYLLPGGSLLLEIGFDQKNEVLAMLRDSGYTEARAVKDLAGLDRVCMACV